jgi:hypothetical protein
MDASSIGMDAANIGRIVSGAPNPTVANLEAARHPSPLYGGPRDHCGRMFWLRWKMLSWSYRRLSAASRDSLPAG